MEKALEHHACSSCRKIYKLFRENQFNSGWNSRSDPFSICHGWWLKGTCSWRFQAICDAQRRNRFSLIRHHSSYGRLHGASLRQIDDVRGVFLLSMFTKKLFLRRWYENIFDLLRPLFFPYPRSELWRYISIKAEIKASIFVKGLRRARREVQVMMEGGQGNFLCWKCEELKFHAVGFHAITRSRVSVTSVVLLTVMWDSS